MSDLLEKGEKARLGHLIHVLSARGQLAQGAKHGLGNLGVVTLVLEDTTQSLDAPLVRHL